MIEDSLKQDVKTHGTNVFVAIMVLNLFPKCCNGRGATISHWAKCITYGSYQASLLNVMYSDI